MKLTQRKLIEKKTIFYSKLERSDKSKKDRDALEARFLDQYLTLRERLGHAWIKELDKIKEKIGKPQIKYTEIGLDATLDELFDTI